MTLHHHFSFEWVTRHDMESNKCEGLLCLEVAQDVDTKVFQQTCGVGLFKAVHPDGTVPVLGQPLDTLHVDPVLHLVLVPVAGPPDRRRRSWPRHTGDRVQVHVRLTVISLSVRGGVIQGRLKIS